MWLFGKMPPDVTRRQNLGDLAMLLRKMKENKELMAQAALGAVLGG